MCMCIFHLQIVMPEDRPDSLAPLSADLQVCSQLLRLPCCSRWAPFPALSYVLKGTCRRARCLL